MVTAEFYILNGDYAQEFWKNCRFGREKLDLVAASLNPLHRWSAG